MAWEARGKGQHRFYYRSRRAGGKVEKVYLGRGDVAREAAEKDAAAKAKRAADHATLAELQAKLAGLDQLVAEVEMGVDVLTEAALFSVGFHQHRGQWRRCRNVETADPTAENMRLARYRMDRRDQAHKQLLTAVKTLTTVRNLVARTNVIQVEFLNPPTIRSPAAPIVPAANGEQPEMNGIQATRAAMPTNRINGTLNGYHNRMNDILEPAKAN